MSKSFGNAIPLEADPEEMYGQVMSIPDVLIIKYFTLLTDLPLQEIRTMEQEMKKGTNPRDLKARLAWELVRMYHSPKDSDKARAAFDKTFKEHAVPDDVPEYKWTGPMTIVELLVATKLAASKSEARRLVDDGGVKIDNEVVATYDQAVAAGQLIQKGKRHFVKTV